MVWNPPLQQSQLQQQQGSSSSDKELNTNGGVNDKRKRSSDDKDMAAWAPKDIAAAFLRKPGSGTMAQFVEELAAVDADADADALGHRTAISSPPVAGAPVGRNGAEEVSVPGRASASMQMLMLSPKKQRFLRACEETRPATMGLARDTRIDDPALQLQLRTALPPAAFMSIHFERKTDAGWSVAAAEPVPTPTVLAASNREYEVRYVGGWKRGRSVAQASSTAPSSIGSTDLFAESGEEDFARASSYFPAESERSDGPIAVPQVRRLSSIFETSNIFCTLVKKHLRTLAFCKVRKLVELVLGYSLRNLETSGAGHLTSSLASYRGGYTKEERRAVESDLFSGRLLGVTATCALELGIDVGALDATLHMGFPGTFASLWQQAGRAGRSGRPSLSIMVCFESPVDQYFARHPQVLFGSPVEPALLDVNNAHILYSHLLCAAEEVPLNYKFSVRSSREPADPGRPVTDLDIWGDRYSELLQYLVEANKICLNSSNGSSRYAMNATRNQPAEDKVESFLSTEWRAPLKSSSSSGKSRASSVSLRMIDPVTISILDDSRGGLVIDSLGYSRAFFELFEGAIYMHRAVQYRVLRLDLAAAVAHTQPVKVRYYTSAQNKTEVNVLKVLEQDGIMSSGAVQVVQTVYGYVKHWLGSGEPFEKVCLESPSFFVCIHNIYYIL